MSQLISILQILAVLGTGLGLGLAFATAIALALLGRRHAARLSMIAGVSVAGLYAIALLIASATSQTKTLALGATKVFCEIDCHVRFAVANMHRDSVSLVIVVREYFDAASISSGRGDAPLTPGTRRIALVDERGSQLSAVSVRAITPAPLFAPLRPGETHDAALTFVVPSTVALRGLLVESDDQIAALLIGHERSPFHSKVLLTLPFASATIPRETVPALSHIPHSVRGALTRVSVR